jgi:hypothetical protein
MEEAVAAVVLCVEGGTTRRNSLHAPSTLCVDIYIYIYIYIVG